MLGLHWFPGFFHTHADTLCSLIYVHIIINDDLCLCCICRIITCFFCVLVFNWTRWCKRTPAVWAATCPDHTGKRLSQNPQSTGAVSAKDDEPATLINQPLIACERPVKQECVLIERDKACEASDWMINWWEQLLHSSQRGLLMWIPGCRQPAMKRHVGTRPQVHWLT